MSVNKFHTRAIEWLRTEHGLVPTPGTPFVPEPTGGTRVRGFFARPSTAGNWAFGGLCALALGAVLSMLRPPGVSPGAQAAIGRLGLATQGAGLTCLITAEMKRRRNRTPGVIELRAKTASPATPASIVDLREGSGRATTWLVAEREISPETLAAAAEHDVRCFVVRGGRFGEDAEVRTQPPVRARGDA